MPKATSTALSERLAALSPQQRAVLARRLLRETSQDAASPNAEIPAYPRSEHREFPLSAAQERMWFNHQWSPDQPLYNESFALQLEGKVRADCMAASFDRVMARHEIFSTTFHSAEGRLFQRVSATTLPRLAIRDMRNVAADGREAAYLVEARALVGEPFRLDKGPLFRAALWRIDESQYRLLFAMHHIIFDGWSGAIFFRELFTTYAALLDGVEPELAPIHLHYADFALWEQSHFEKSAPLLDSQLDYWKKQLQGITGPPQLPVDRQVSDDAAHASGREVFHCPIKTVDELKRLARESNATLFMALLAIFNVLLMRYSGQEDVLVGLPTTNRNQNSLNGIIGVFINTVILRTDLSGNVTFRELLARVRDVALQAQANQEVPFQRVVRALDLKGDGGRSLVRVLFDFQKKVDHFVETPGFTVQGTEVTSGVAKFDLVLAMEDSGEQIKGILDYDIEKFEPATARQTVRHFIALMQSAVTEPDVPVNLLPMLDADEAAQIEMRGIDTSGKLPNWACLETEAHARKNPQALALTDGAIQITFGELNARACRVAAFLHSRNIGPQQTVALLLRPGPDLVVAQFGVMKAGAAFVPIDPTWPPARAAFLVRDSRAALTVADDAWRADAVEPGMATISLAQILNDSGAEDMSSRPNIAGPDDPAYVIYTSGSTGQPKGVAVSRSGLANLAAWHRRAFAISSTDRASQVASVSFDASVWEIWGNIAAGASLHFPPPGLIADAARMRDWLARHEITISFAPTLLGEELIELDWPPSTRLRWLLTGGDRLRKHPRRELTFRLVNNYGPTEASVVTTSGVVNSAAQQGAPSIGRPIDNVWVRIVDRNLQPVPPGVWGELIVGGRGIANGYWGSEERAQGGFETLPDGRRVYRTGDLCRFRRDGEIEFLGRADRQVKIHGCRIEPGEIERSLLEFPAIREAAVVARGNPDGRTSIVAYVVPDGPALSSDVLRTYLAGKLPAYMLPSSFVTIGKIPRTTSGKTDLERLAADSNSDAPRAAYCKSRTVTESRLADLWQQILRLPSVGVHDDFFQIGGDSLSATRLAVRIREQFGVDLPLARLVTGPTIEALANFVDSSTPQTKNLPKQIVALRSGSPAQPPLFLAPPASGSPACYALWASAFKQDRAVYGLLSPGFTDGNAAISIPDQARAYLEGIYAVQPAEPYYIAGWSLGAPVAFEIACQLREAGKQVAYLGLIDAALPENGRLPGNISLLRGLWWAVSYPFSERMPLNYATVRQLANFVGVALPSSLADVRHRGWAASLQFLAELLAGACRSLRVFLANIRGLRTYQPRRFDGVVTLFRTKPPAKVSEDVLRESMWKWCARVDVHDAPGTHMTLILDPRQATHFAPLFETTLEPALKLVAAE